MAAVNSLLFLLSTIAPYTEHPEYSAVTYPPTDLNTGDVYSLSKDNDSQLNTVMSLEPARICRENEEYKNCGSFCPKNCLNKDKEIVCHSICVKGCFCKEPMLRDLNGKCIYEEECPRDPRARTGLDVICREAEEYVDCEDSHPYFPSSECVPGCYCKYPWLRSDNGKCFFKESSSFLFGASRIYSDFMCPDDQVYLFCGSACERNCNFSMDKPCVDMCVRGCFCKEPKVFGPNGDCILPEQCPSNPSEPKFSVPTLRVEVIENWTSECNPNSEFSVLHNTCVDTCDSYQSERFCSNVFFVTPCDCKNGYVKGKEGSCVKIEECQEQTPNDCSDLEYYDDCGSYCETDCYSYMTPNRTCENKECKKGCFCNPGYVREGEWKCILPEDCKFFPYPLNFVS